MSKTITRDKNKDTAFRQKLKNLRFEDEKQVPKIPPADLPAIGDIVSVTYLSGAPIQGKIVSIFNIAAEAFEEAKKYYPNIQPDDKGYVVEAGGDTRNFLAEEITIIHRAPQPHKPYF